MPHFAQGVVKFQREVFPEKAELFERLATGQSPEALFITCSDSRIETAMLTQTDPGELFICRNAGNIVPSYGPEPGGVSATVEYAVAVLGVQDIVICGHSDCGAMGAISRCTCLDHLPAVANWLRHSDAAKAINAAHEFDTPRAKLDGLVESGRGARRNRRPAGGAIGQDDIHLDGRVAARIQDFAADDIDNCTHDFTFPER